MEIKAARQRNDELDGLPDGGGGSELDEPSRGQSFFNWGEHAAAALEEEREEARPNAWLPSPRSEEGWDGDGEEAGEELPEIAALRLRFEDHLTAAHSALPTHRAPSLRCTADPLCTVCGPQEHLETLWGHVTNRLAALHKQLHEQREQMQQQQLLHRQEMMQQRQESPPQSSRNSNRLPC